MLNVGGKKKNSERLSKTMSWENEGKKEGKRRKREKGEPREREQREKREKERGQELR